MVKVWGEGGGADKECDACGSVYAVTYQRFPSRESDGFNCEICGKELERWNSTHQPDFKLIKPGKKPT